VRFLVHGNLSPAVGAALQRLGHSVEQFPSDGLSPDELLEQCHVKQLDLVTNDAALAHGVIASPPAAKFDRCIVFLQLPGGDAEQGGAIDRLFKRFKRLSPKKMYTVTETRVKVRQLPEGK
jgi:hypothetical protein